MFIQSKTITKCELTHNYYLKLPVLIFVSKTQIMPPPHGREFQRDHASMRAVEKCLRAPASQHTSNFWVQYKQRPNSASTFKLNGTIRLP